MLHVGLHFYARKSLLASIRLKLTFNNSQGAVILNNMLPYASTWDGFATSIGAEYWIAFTYRQVVIADIVVMRVVFLTVLTTKGSFRALG